MSETVTIQVPLTIRRRGGRKVVLSPTGQAQKPDESLIDNTLFKALARAFRWQRILESGDYASVNELAAAEKINAPYLGRILRLTLLPPSLIDGIMDGQKSDLLLADLIDRSPTHIWAVPSNFRRPAD